MAPGCAGETAAEKGSEAEASIKRFFLCIRREKGASEATMRCGRRPRR